VADVVHARLLAALGAAPLDVEDGLAEVGMATSPAASRRLSATEFVVYMRERAQ